MEFMFDYVRLPKNQKMLIDINSAAKRLFYKLRDLDIDTIDISDYNKRYLGDKLAGLKAILQNCTYILSWSIANSDIPISRFVFLEYGGGSGMLCLLAKELGVGTVIYNDIYDISCSDAKCIAESIGEKADYYVQGNIDDVLNFLRTNDINCDAVASSNVIEHIYDIESFFRKIAFLSDGPLTVVMSSPANTFNLFIRWIDMKKQLEAENKDREKKWGHKGTDCLQAYLKVRKEIIYEYLQELNKKLTEEEIMQLSRNTRGMIKADIRNCVDGYLATGKLPKKPSHPTNTCDPLTGNWAEHLMDPYHLASILSNAGFEVQVISGFYGHRMNVIKRILFRFLDIVIYIFKKQGIRIAPFYMVCGRRKPI